jgi:hypothetical protein
LLLVILGVGQQSRDVKHDLVPFVDCVDTVGSRHIPCTKGKWIYRTQMISQAFILWQMGGKINGRRMEGSIHSHKLDAILVTTHTHTHTHKGTFFFLFWDGTV